MDLEPVGLRSLQRISHKKNKISHKKNKIQGTTHQLEVLLGNLEVLWAALFLADACMDHSLHK
jgi:hypothetical protein